MLRYSICDLLGTELPIIYTGMRPFASDELVAVCQTREHYVDWELAPVVTRSLRSILEIGCPARLEGNFGNLADCVQIDLSH
jgi:hypothetical protein